MTKPRTEHSLHQFGFVSHFPVVKNTGFIAARNLLLEVNCVKMDNLQDGNLSINKINHH